jgi:rhodanese-related sulfurtransferase
MSPSEVLERARRGEVEVLDVSEAHEWSWERLPIGGRVDWTRVLSRDRSWIPEGKTLVFACRLGGRSQIAAQTLAREGYTTANLSGGVWAWQGVGLPVVRGDARGNSNG